MMRIDSKAWDEGFKAGETSRGLGPTFTPIAELCPYSPGSGEAFSWYSGFIEGDAKRHGYSYSRGARNVEEKHGGQK